MALGNLASASTVPSRWCIQLTNLDCCVKLYFATLVLSSALSSAPPFAPSPTDLYVDNLWKREHSTSHWCLPAMCILPRSPAAPLHWPSPPSPDLYSRSLPRSSGKHPLDSDQMCDFPTKPGPFIGDVGLTVFSIFGMATTIFSLSLSRSLPRAGTPFYPIMMCSTA